MTELFSPSCYSFAFSALVALKAHANFFVTAVADFGVPVLMSLAVDGVPKFIYLGCTQYVEYFVEHIT